MFKILKSQIFLFSFFLMLYAIVYIVTTTARDKLINDALSQEMKNLENSFNISTNSFTLMSDSFYNTILNKEDVLRLMYKAKHSKDDLARAKIRKKLNDKMQPYFREFKKVGVNIIQFVLEDNKSFLRVHKPNKFGDDLSSVRYSIAYANENKELVRGLEQGKVSHAFRNVFPLFYKGEHIGSIDVSFSSEVIQDNMIKLHDTHTHFLLNKSLFEVNIWERQKKIKYVQSLENEDFIFALTKNHSAGTFTDNENNINKKFKKDIEENLKHNTSFSLYNDGLIITFLAIKNIKEKKTVAYLVSYVESFTLKDILQVHLIVNIIIFTSLMIIYLVIANSIRHRIKLQVQVEEELEKNKKQQQTMFNQSRLAQMGEMISMIAHQWRQPLGTISSTSLDLQMRIELSNFDLEDKNTKKDYKSYFTEALKTIDGLVQNLSVTIDDFRNFYKPNKERTSVKLKDTILKALNIIKSSFIVDNIEVSCEYIYDEEVMIYEHEMLHVILNILQNAQDNFKDKKVLNPKINIEVNENSISICDNGGGIPGDIIEKIFDPYFSTKNAKNGTGLGLYMSKMIIEDHHNGKLIVENKNDWACFTINIG